VSEGFKPNWAENSSVVPHIENLDRAANLSHWLKNYVAKMPNLSAFRQFEIQQTEETVTVVRARERCVDDAEHNPWKSLELQVGEHTKVKVVESNRIQLSSL
jgi:hypothetical protein